MAGHIRDLWFASQDELIDFEKGPFKAKKFSSNTFVGYFNSAYFCLSVDERQDDLEYYDSYSPRGKERLINYHIKVASNKLEFLEMLINAAKNSSQGGKLEVR